LSLRSRERDVSAIAREGLAVEGIGVPTDDDTLAPILDAIVEAIPEPVGDAGAPLQALVTNLDASDYLGRLAMGRVIRGSLKAGTNIALIQREDKEPTKRRLGQLMGFADLGRVDVDEIFAGDLFVVAGFPEVQIGDTFSDPETLEALPRLTVDEPVLRMTFGVNTSPLAGTEGRYLTSRQIRDRLEKEVLGNVSIRIGETSSPGDRQDHR
jgi:GTP-binding protein